MVLFTVLNAMVVHANTPQTMQFVINAPQLAPALIQFSHQSGLAIVFSARITRNLPAPPLTGTMSTDEALNHLLRGSSLTWKLVDSRVVAVYEARCDEQTQSYVARRSQRAPRNPRPYKV